MVSQTLRSNMGC